MRSFTGYNRGVDLGGWLSQCGKNNYYALHYDSFITEQDFARIARWGLDHVRLPVDAEVIQNTDGTLREDGLRYIDSALIWCRGYGLKMVLDLHKAHGYVFDDETNNSFFYNERLQDLFVNLWETLAKRYSSQRDILALELLNEVTDREYAVTWNRVAARALEAIRRIDREIRVVIGGVFNDSIFGLTLLDPPADENVVFTFHCYSPLIFTHQGAPWVRRMPSDPALWKRSYPGSFEEYRDASLKLFGDDFASEFPESLRGTVDRRFFENLFAPALEIAEKYNVPLYCGEYGVIDRADPHDALQWYRDITSVLEAHGIARTAWSWKRMDFGLIDPWLDPVREELIRVL